MLDELLHPTLLHPLTGEPLRAVGVVNGRVIWPIMGAAEDDDAGDDDGQDESEGDESDDDGGSEGSDDGKDWQSQFDGQKKVNRSLERKTKSDLARIKQLEADLAAAKKGKQDDDDKPDPEALREAAKAEARAEVLRDRVSDKIEAKARKFADPEDAVAILLRQNDIEDFIDDGKVDVDAIAEALQDLAKKKPHLLAKGKRFEGGGDGGARKESGKAIDEQIAEAQKAGDFQKAIALKQRRAAEAKAK